MNEIMETKLRLNLIFFGWNSISPGFFASYAPPEVQYFFLRQSRLLRRHGYVVWNRLSANAEQDVMETRV